MATAMVETTRCSKGKTLRACGRIANGGKFSVVSRAATQAAKFVGREGTSECGGAPRIAVARRGGSVIGLEHSDEVLIGF